MLHGTMRGAWRERKGPMLIVLHAALDRMAASLWQGRFFSPYDLNRLHQSLPLCGDRKF